MSNQPKDRFSNYAAGYAAFRPTYPVELYEFILSQVVQRDYVWDCATGNGQVAKDLSAHFNKVFATDISARQLENAHQQPNIEYSISPAEKTSFPDSSFDLITVGQALHWFDFPSFYAEALRVSKPDGVLAAWGYGLVSISPEIDMHISHFYRSVIGPYWDPERKWIDDHFGSIPFPFKEIPSPEFSISLEWTLFELHGYLTTWSSVQKYIRENEENPVDLLIEKLGSLWPGARLKVIFPLFLRCGRIEK
ncbi:MAG TPA: class I SAM-dependent methyltransferase [Cyclobacteriaceae bacterium]|nr:class I SAM-dependent methyltransferase [Cyclobacteriaceae bacterium]